METTRLNNSLALDVTKTFESGFQTGIQRVVRELVRRRNRIGNLLGRDVAIVVASNGGYRRMDDASLESLLHPPHTKGSAIVAQSGIARRVKGVLQSNALIYTTVQRWILRYRMAQLTRNFVEHHTGPGDIIAMIDYLGAGSPSISSLLAAKRCGAATVAIVYDIIPLRYPDMVPKMTAAPYLWAFRRLVGRVDGLITISRSEADAIRDQPLVRAANVPVENFYLGQDLELPDTMDAQTTIPEGAWGGGPTFVMVGSIEPRKRHGAILDAFEKLWAMGVSANLLIIGKVGWEIDDFLDRVRQHRCAGTSLFLCHQVGDRELNRAMTRAAAVIMASKAEGFGLPIVEALALGVPVIACDIPIFREIAGPAGCYFPPDDMMATAEVIRSFILHLDVYRHAAQAFRWIDWDTSADQFALAVQTVLREPSRV